MKSPMIGLTGGIGSGKSVVSRILAIKGYNVVDTDRLAKEIMDSSDSVKTRITAEIDPACVTAGRIDPRRLADIVFADSTMLAVLNNIVHGMVRERLMEMAEESGAPFFVETAIFRSSGLWRMCRSELRVTAPEELRIERVARRNGLDAAAVRARMEAQQNECELPEDAPPVNIIVNDGIIPLLPQINTYISKI